MMWVNEGGSPQVPGRMLGRATGAEEANAGRTSGATSYGAEGWGPSTMLGLWFGQQVCVSID